MQGQDQVPPPPPRQLYNAYTPLWGVLLPPTDAPSVRISQLQ